MICRKFVGIKLVVKKVFFLDDDQDFLEVVKMFVELNTNSQVMTADTYDATIALKQAILDSDLIFLDINLGRGRFSGLDVCRWFRENGYQKKIYFLTGHAKNSTEVRAVESLDQVGVLTKPYPFDDLLSLIKDPTL